MIDWILYVRDLIHDTVWVWFRDIIIWNYLGGEKRFLKRMAKCGIYFDDKGSLII